MKTFYLKIKSNNGEEEEEITLKFEPKEIQILKRYVKNCERLKNTPILEKFPVIKSIKWNCNDRVMEFNISEFDYKQIFELLHLARPIFLDKEPASFKKVKSIIGKKFKYTRLASILKEIGYYYEKGEYQPYFQCYIHEVDGNKVEEWLKGVDFKYNNPLPLFDEKMTTKWLNGTEYHQDEEKEKIVKRIEESLTQKTARGIFVSQISGRLKAIFWLEKLLQLIMNNEQIE